MKKLQLKPLIKETMLKEELSADVMRILILLLFLGPHLAITSGLAGKLFDENLYKKASRWVKDNWRLYTQIKPILKKLDSDPEVKEFIRNQSPNQSNHKGFHNLIKNKLTPEEQRIIKLIRFKDLPSVKSNNSQIQEKKMKKSQLQKIIKEELARALKEDSPHSIKADLQIYKSELNMLNKIKANRPERKAALEKKIADLEAKLGSR